MRSPQQHPGQLWLGREHHLLVHPGQLPVLLADRACLGQVQRPVDQRVATGCGEGQGDGDLAQRDPAYGAAVLAGRADGHYLEPSLCMPHLTRTSAAWTCS
jgi:hypothetical protein